ncbi:MAG TPA: hypothetical protein VF663_08140 [Telluria sp.]
MLVAMVIGAFKVGAGEQRLWKLEINVDARQMLRHLHDINEFPVKASAITHASAAASAAPSAKKPPA